MIEYPLNHQPGSVPDNVAQIPFFQKLAPEIIDEMLSSITILDCEAGDIIIEEGVMERDLLFLLKGEVRIQKDNSTIETASGSGDLLGEIALLKDGQRTATIVAETQVYCLKVKQKFLDGLATDVRSAYYAAMYRFLAELLARRLDTTSEKLANAEKKLAELQGS